MVGEWDARSDQSKADNHELQTRLEIHQNQSRAEKNALQTQLENQRHQSRVKQDELQAQYEDQLAQSVKEKDELRLRYDSLHQRFYSPDKFTARRSIWLLVRIRQLLKDGDQSTSAPPLTDFQVSYVRSKKFLTCRPAHSGQECIPASEPFEIDHYLGPSSTNRDVYREVEPLIDILFSGYDVCMFTDGQSGSGKSWTMFKGNDAVAPSIAASVMTWKAAGDTQGGSRRVRCSAIEVYQDRLKDLLVENGEAKVDLSEGKKYPCERRANSVEELIGLFQRAYKNLEIKETHENRESSRGHFVCTLNLVQIRSKQSCAWSRITLVDLAGRERIHTGPKNRPPQTTGVKGGSSNAAADEADSSLTAETKFINSSRRALRTFLQQIKWSKPRPAACEVRAPSTRRICRLTSVQFTRYLNFVLGPNPRLIYLAHLDPLSDQYGRTLDTLKFAKEVSQQS